MYLRDTPIYQSSPLFPYTTLFRSDDAVSVPGAAYRTGGSGFCRNYQGFGRDGMKRATALLLLAGSLAGCASHSAGESPWLVERDVGVTRQCDPLTADQELVLGLSGEMASAGRRHAALANLERLPGDLPQVRLHKARLLRILGHGNEAETLYRSLLGSCLSAQANHGLGQIEASRAKHSEAQRYLRTASALAPADSAIRNDLGVVYMNQRRLAEARFELLTAMELEEGSQRAAQNMLTLLLYQGNWQAAQELVAARGLTSSDFSRAEQRARSMQREDAPSSAPAPAPAPAPASAAPPLVTPEPAGMAAAVASLSGTPVQRGITAAEVRPASPVGTEQPLRPQPAATRTEPAPVRKAMPLAAAVRAWSEADGSAEADSPSRSGAGATHSRALVCRSARGPAGEPRLVECQPE